MSEHHLPPSRQLLATIATAVLYGLVLITLVGLLDRGFHGWARSATGLPVVVLVLGETLLLTSLLGVALYGALRARALDARDVT